MLQPPRRGAPGGPALIRLLARLADLEVSAPGQSLSDQLSRWLSWTDAITLSSALNLGTPTGSGPAPAHDEAGRECARVRAALAKSIDGVAAFGAGRGGGAPPAPPVAPKDAALDFAVLRQDYQFIQQSMQTEIGLLRARLRRAMTASTPELARLAVLDATFEQALDARERSLLGAVPTLLGARFEQLRRADARAGEPAPDASTSGAWLGLFRQDMRGLLLAELDIRFQPVEGLLAALRTSQPPGRHVQISP
ncbi:DUF3348 domain-containing protein [Burkholderia sp. FERM BP-3421]|uniref:DUF3348 domain-containing protein n=1 Tax=Burkholderia sp. FERM BP-3421 TaxID=1494466 RepID=UPI00235ED6CD|nr:DUF3348 domain-containing protein [Burkholderia sp. FERM BP-3421]WDD91630.1 DUF3348 domain-containing protein [Burkholderia sp. FERM BP-3421]